MIVDDAAAADPRPLAAVATALVSAHGRLPPIDTGEPGPARRLFDSLTLSWSEKAPSQRISKILPWHAPQNATRTPLPTAAASSPTDQHATRGRDRDRGHGLDLD